MTPSSQRESAKIYQFPLKRRAPAGGQRDAAPREIEAVMPRYASAAFGSGWYHEAAIEEAVRALKR
jgi:Protein of unknown function (DUF2735)